MPLSRVLEEKSGVRAVRGNAPGYHMESACMDGNLTSGILDMF
jgi:hypothetical protein